MNIVEWVLNIRNLVDYPLREFIHLKRGKVSYDHDKVYDDYADLPEPDRTRARQFEAGYRFKYRLDRLKQVQTAGNYYENIFYIHILEETFNQIKPDLPRIINAVDIGTSHWFYVQSLWSFFSWYETESPRQLVLEGYETDPYRVYADFHSRYDHAMTHIDSLPDVHFHPFGFDPKDQEYDIATLFFPFVFKSDHLQWGLPANKHHPEELIQAAWKSLRSGGILMIVNQGQKEHQQELQILEKLAIPIQTRLHIDPLLYKYDYDRYVIAAIK